MSEKPITPQTEAVKLTESLIKEYPALTDFSIVLKREDLHPYGSHKGRSIPYMIDEAIKKGATSFVISSSGNAAIAAAKHITNLSKDDLHLEIFCGTKIAQGKLEILKEIEKSSGAKIHITITERPLQGATIYANQNAGTISLRQSTDDIALIGYKGLAEELATIPNLRAVFIGTSSGTTAQALAKYFTESPKNVRNAGEEKENEKVEVHIVQTSSCYPLAESLGAISINTDTNGVSQEDKSIADAIVDKTVHRKEAICAVYKAYPEASSDLAHIVSNSQIGHAIELLKAKEGLKVSPNGALGLAGLIDSLNSGKTWKGTVVCIICGQ